MQALPHHCDLRCGLFFTSCTSTGFPCLPSVDGISISNEFQRPAASKIRISGVLCSLLYVPPRASMKGIVKGIAAFKLQSNTTTSIKNTEIGTGSRHCVRDRVVAFELAARKLPAITLRCGASVQLPRHYAPCASSRLRAASPDAMDQRFNAATSWYQDSDAAGSPRRLVHHSSKAGGARRGGPGFAVPRFG